MKPKITLSMPASLIEKLKRLADRENRSLSNLVWCLLEEALNRRSSPDATTGDATTGV